VCLQVLCKIKTLTKCGSYEVYAIVNTHNHDLNTPEELQQLPQIKFIPEAVQYKMLELHKLGVLNPSQIMVLIESEFLETTVIWTKSYNSLTEDDRLSELTALSKDLILRSVSDDQIYEMVKSSLKLISLTVSKSQHLVQSSQETNIPTIHNP
jgi:hypothetical protein